ncbi:protein of unknown function [Lishizhenia tianjinensis]|uniref:DUF4835 domain-containing protein n=1 Tax=Lishizhenia tianjinensis TaxID=477690 RepID=A0A1I6Z1J6_9FLAO|nr:DUF4835 family protein [Lishizhenia tianjinensis]SFT56610.1 protein of unknown function [Lishizhenia tianjinensis]
MIKYLSILALVVFSFGTQAQELDCQVSIGTKPGLDVTSVEQEIFKELKQTIYEFMNTTVWTNDEFEVEERISCALEVQITAIPSPGNYAATLQIQSTRPVLNSTYNSTLFSFLDSDFNFKYSRGAIIMYSPNEYKNELTSMLAFYANIILGYDYDSFSLKGGQKYFEQAQTIVIQAGSRMGAGWVSDDRDRNNRYFLVDYILQPKFEPLREMYYTYHRKGLDQLYTDATKARATCFNALKKLEDVHRIRPGAMNVVNFAKMKLSEVKGMYADAETSEKNEVVNLLKRVDPANSTRYQEILSE